MTTPTLRKSGYPALTTIFTPPASCLTRLPTIEPSWYRYHDPNRTTTRIDLYVEYNANYSYANRECHPPLWGLHPYVPEGVPREGDGHYLDEAFSPGVCPSGHTTGFQTTDGPRTWVACCVRYVKYLSTKEHKPLALLHANRQHPDLLVVGLKEESGSAASNQLCRWLHLPGQKV